MVIYMVFFVAFLISISLIILGAEGIKFIGKAGGTPIDKLITGILFMVCGYTMLLSAILIYIEKVLI